MAAADDPNGRFSRRSLLRGGVAAAAGLALAACSAVEEPVSKPRPRTTGTPSPTQTATPSPTPEPVDPASVKANELGVIPVLMYHRIVADVQGPFGRTPADFRAELQRLFSSGYRPVRTIDLVRGDLDVPAGTTPCVLTFDDGYVEHLRFTPDGELDPACATAVIRDVAKEFENTRGVASYNINARPWALSDPDDLAHAFRTLHGFGFEVANHTYGHDNLSKLDAAAVQRDFVLLEQLVEDAVPGVAVCTTALPFGVSPRDRALAHTGSWQGESYTNEGVLRVGAQPASSPFSPEFEPLSLPRVRSTSYPGVEWTSDYWLDYLDAHPEKRYVSAGDPGHVTVPAGLAGKVNPAYADRVVTY